MTTPHRRELSLSPGQQRGGPRTESDLVVRRGELPPDGLASYQRPIIALPGFQRTYDLMARHMLSQVSPARTRHGQNRYRLPDGRKCPVGALIGAGSGDVENLSALDPFMQEVLRRRGHNAGLA